MDNYVQPGEVVTLTPPVGGVVSGTPYQIGQILVIATKTVTAAEALAGATFEGLRYGVVTGPKTDSQAWTEGALIYWDDTEGEFTTTAAGNLLVGYAAEAVAGTAGLTTGTVILDGCARANEAS